MPVLLPPQSQGVMTVNELELELDYPLSVPAAATKLEAFVPQQTRPKYNQGLPVAACICTEQVICKQTSRCLPSTTPTSHHRRQHAQI